MNGSIVTDMPAMYHHCVQVYAEMLKTARTSYPDEGPQGEDFPPQVIWEGHLTKLIQDLHLPQPYYTEITNKLKAMHCMEQIKRGGGGGNSEWLLLQEPTQELWAYAEDAPSAKARKPTPMEQLQQQFRDLVTRQGQLENRLDQMEIKMEELQLRLLGGK